MPPYWNSGLNYAIDQFQATARAWRSEFRGPSEAASVLLDVIKECEMSFQHSSQDHSAKAYYSRSFSIIQSSGTGKSRMVDETAKQIFTFQMNLRVNTDYNGVPAAYPLPDPEIRQFLIENWRYDESSTEQEAQHFWLAFVVALFEQANHTISVDIKLPTSDSEHGWARWETLVQEFRLLMSKGVSEDGHGEYHTKFYQAVITRAKENLKAWKSSGTCRCSQYGRLLTCKAVEDARRRIDVFRRTLFGIEGHLLPQWTGGVMALLSFDEGHEMNNVRNYRSPWSLWSALQRMLHVLNEPFYAVSLSTKVQPSWIDYDRIIPTFTETGFGQLSSPVQLDQPLSDFTRTSYVVTLGRPLFATRYEAANSVVKQGIVDFAVCKLLCQELGGQFITVPAALACLATRLALQFSSTEQGVEAAGVQVERHMRLCLSTSDPRHGLVTTASSEPLLARAAQIAMARKSFNAAQILVGALEDSCISAGERGEVIAPLLLLMAYDRAQAAFDPSLQKGDQSSEDEDDGQEEEEEQTHQDNDGEDQENLADEDTDDSDRCVHELPVNNFLRSLWNIPSESSQSHMDFRKSKPAVIQDTNTEIATTEATLTDAFKDYWCGFNHFVKLREHKLINRRYLCALLTRHAAAICEGSSQFFVDIVIPLLHSEKPARAGTYRSPRGAKVSPKNISAILIRVELDSSYGAEPKSHLFEALDPYSLGVFRESEGESLPVIRIVFTPASPEACLKVRPFSPDSPLAPAPSVPENPQENSSKSKRQSDVQPEVGDYTAYDIWCGGVKGSIFKGLEPHSENFWTKLIELCCPWAAVHKAKGPESRQEMSKMMDVGALGDAEHWGDYEEVLQKHE